MKFLAKNIKYPAVALQNKIEGRVIVQFVVKQNGKVADLKVVRGVTPELDAEALRVVGLMPDWIPGKQRGQAVSVKYTMPIMFRTGSSAPKEEVASASQIVPNAKPVVQDGEIFTVVEEMPQFPGGMGEAMKFLAKNIKYPAVALQNKIEGRVIVQFVVKENGKVADIKVMRGVSPELDAEAIRVVGLMPDWIPGKQRGKAVAVKYTMPIMFRLDSPAPKEEAASAPSMMHLNVEKGASQANVENVKSQVRSQVNGMAVRGAEGKSPLVVVDGKEVGYGASLISEIPIGDIQLISVLNEKNSIAKYGEKAKDGAIEIKTKKK
jgi:TonB family protein